MERSLRIHDEILLKAPIEETNEVVLILKETMEDAGLLFFLKKDVKIRLSSLNSKLTISLAGRKIVKSAMGQT
jgi:DNA polymerase I-like protein with 3'-5' exonuclease and polymerase domains